MKVLKNKIAIVFVGIFLIIILTCGLFGGLKKVYADNDIALTPEMYTEKDYLLNVDGSLSESKITDFAQTVINSSSTTNLSDLTKVIPVEYLRTTGEEKYYAYNGLEYGFYVRHRAVTPMNIYGGTPFDPVYVLDILLINFRYEPTADIKEFKIRIEPLFSETFLYSNTNGIEKWTRITGAYNLGSVHGSPDLYQDYRAKLWIKNPRFATYLLNENEKNVGDVGYNSVDDNGLKIEQSRVNYSGYQEASKKYADSLIETGLNVFTGIVGLATGAFVPSTLANIITAIDLTKSFALSTSEYFSNQFENIECNNEANIISALGDYKDDPYHARAMLVEPVDELVFKAGDSYAENIIRVDEIDRRTRITQICMFDIMSSLNLNAIDGECLNETDEEGNSIPFAFGRQGVYYDDVGISDIPSNNFNVDVPYYLLSDGDQQFQYKPFATGNYFITSEKPVSIYYNDEKLNTNDYNFNVTLTQDLNYKIVVESEEEIESTFSIAFSPPALLLGTNTLSFDNEAYEFYILNGVYEYYNIQSNDTSLHIRVYNDKQETLQQTIQNSRFYSGNEKLYVLIGYSSAKTQTLNIICNREKELVFVSSDVSVPAQTVINGALTSLPIPTREGFIFNGWYLNSTYTGTSVTVEQVMQAQSPTVTLYAKWTIDNDYTFSITYTPLMADGTDVEMNYIHWANKDEDYTTEESVVFPTLESVKYELVGWYYDADFTQVCTTWSVPVGSYGHKIFYAKLTLRIYTVSFNANTPYLVDPIIATYQQIIRLPDIDRADYIGTWGEWGAKLNNGEYPTNFGGEYVVESDVTLVAQWKRIYNIIYKNITYNGYDAYIYYDNLPYGPSYYVYGEGADLNRITAGFHHLYTDGYNVEFIGWYNDQYFTSKMNTISASRTGDVELYAKWQFDYGFFCGSVDEIITDSSEFSQDYYITYYIGDLPYEKMRAIGITDLVIEFYIRMYEIDDGYQEVLLYAGETDDYLLWSDTDIEHGPGSKLTTPDVYSATIPLTLDQIEATGCDFLYFRFGANGNKDDDWVIEYQAFEIYLTAKDEAVVDNKSWSDINPLD